MTDIRSKTGWYETQFWDPKGTYARNRKRGSLVFHQRFIHRGANGANKMIDYVIGNLNEERIELRENQSIIRTKEHYASRKPFSSKQVKGIEKTAKNALLESEKNIELILESIKNWEYFRPEQSHFHPEGIDKPLVEERYCNPLELEMSSTLSCYEHNIITTISPDLIIKVNSKAWDYFMDKLDQYDKIRQKSPEIEYFNLSFSPWYAAQIPAEFVDLLVNYPWKERHGAHMEGLKIKDLEVMNQLASHPGFSFK